MGGITTALIGSFIKPVIPARYFILQALAIRGGGGDPYLQLSEFNIMNGGTRLTSATYSNWNLSFASAGEVSPFTTNSPSNEGPSLANDGSTGTKWLDFRGAGGGLIIDLGTAQASTGYQWSTANDATWRDLGSWRVWASNDKTTWTSVSNVSGFSATGTRFALAGSWNWTL
jgi:hypothetical protein